MFFGTFWEHHTCFYNYHVLIISYLCAILCYSEEIAQRISRPLTKTSSLVTVHTIAYGNNHIQIIDISLIPFSVGGSYPSFLDN